MVTKPRSYDRSVARDLPSSDNTVLDRWGTEPRSAENAGGFLDCTGTALRCVVAYQTVSSGCSALAGANIEIWQCDASGHYSEYAQPGYDGTGPTYLRGLQTTDADGQVTFVTVYPGW